MMGYLDVAQDATTLSFSAAVVLLFGIRDTASYGPGVASATAWRENGERILLFDQTNEGELVEPCECGPIRRGRVGPLTRSFDLQPFRGERLLVIASANFQLEPLAMLIDDLRVD